MSKDNIFPQFGDRSIPDILSKLFLHVNYHDEIRRFRLVSQSWRDFIDHEILAKPKMGTLLMEKDFVDAWTKRPPKKTVLKEASQFRLSPVNHVGIEGGSEAHMTGDYVFVNDVNSKKTSIYRNLAYVGYIKSDKPMLVVPCNGYFLDMNDIIVTDAPLAIKAYEQNDDNDEFLPLDLPIAVNLTGLELLALKALDENKLFLICADHHESQLVLLNLVDHSVNRIKVDKVDQLVSCSDGHFRADEGHLAVDQSGLLLFKSGEGLLRLIDYVGGEEMWIQGVNDALGDGCFNKVVMTSIFVALISTPAQGHDDRHRTVHFYSSKTGQLLKSLQISEFNCLGFMGPMLTWRSRAEPYVHFFNPSQDRMTMLDVMKHTQSLCLDCEVMINLTQLNGVIEGRIALMTLRCKCLVHHLVAVDLLKVTAHVLHSKGRCEYQVSAKQGRVLCQEHPSSYELLVLDFGSQDGRGVGADGS